MRLAKSNFGLSIIYPDAFNAAFSASHLIKRGTEKKPIKILLKSWINAVYTCYLHKSVQEEGEMLVKTRRI